MNKTEIAKTMIEIATAYVEHYITDLAYDFETLFTTDAPAYVWAIRDTGTRFTTLDSDIKDSVFAHAVEGGYDDRYFIITDVVNEVTREEMWTLINK